MLALVKTPHTELSINGKGSAAVLACLQERFDVRILEPTEEGDGMPVEETEFWREMEKNRAGNLLAGARLKAELTQAQLAEQMSIRQSMVSDYERGKRSITPEMARRFSQALGINENHLKPGEMEAGLLR